MPLKQRPIISKLEILGRSVQCKFPAEHQPNSVWQLQNTESSLQITLEDQTNGENK